jgi:SAM-dependent methyltransferase
MDANEKETVRSGYNAIAARYLASRTIDSPDVRLLEDLTGRLPPSAKILDAGCGAGVPVTQILSRAFDVTGGDFSEAQLRLARGLVPKARFVCLDLARLAFPDQSFDAVCSYYAVIHIPRREHRAVLQGFHRLLKPSGLALLCLGANDLAEDYEEDYLGTRMYWSHFDAETNMRMVKACGFRVIWNQIVADASSPGSGHLFLLAQKGAA